MRKFFDLFLNWHVPASPAEMLANADVVLTHEFGDQKIPSQTTISIVQAGVAICRRYGKPLICQFPGDRIAQENGTIPFRVIKEHLLKPGEYLDTEEVNRQVAEICAEQGWKAVVVCTHPHHMWRAGKNLERHGPRVVYPDMSSVRYDKQCSRKELRTPWRFIRREIFRARPIYRRRGWL